MATWCVIVGNSMCVIVVYLRRRFITNFFFCSGVRFGEGKCGEAKSSLVHICTHLGWLFSIVISKAAIEGTIDRSIPPANAYSNTRIVKSTNDYAPLSTQHLLINIEEEYYHAEPYTVRPAGAFHVWQ